MDHLVNDRQSTLPRNILIGIFFIRKPQQEQLETTKQIQKENHFPPWDWQYP